MRLLAAVTCSLLLTAFAEAEPVPRLLETDRASLPEIPVSGGTIRLERVADRVALKLAPSLRAASPEARLAELRAVLPMADGAEPRALGFDGWVSVPLRGIRTAEAFEDLRDGALRRGIATAAHAVYIREGAERGTLVPGDRLIVRLAEGERLDTVTARRGVVPRNAKELLPGLWAFTVPPEELFTLAEALDGTDGVRYAVPVFHSEIEPHGAAPDSFYPFQWTLKNTGQQGAKPGIDINVEPAWAITRGARHVTIAVYDDGVEPDHPEFATPGKIVGGLAVRVGEPSGAPRSPSDRHGQAVAGIAVADSSADLGIAGVAPGCSLMPVYGVYDSNDEQVAAGFLHMGRNGAAVSNNSWGYGDASYLPLVVEEALAEVATHGRNGFGMPLVFSSGNSNLGTTTRLIESPWTIGVAALADSGKKANYSNSGRAIDVCAPSGGALDRFFPSDDATTSGVLTTDRSGNLGYNVGSRGKIPWMLGPHNPGTYFVQFQSGIAIPGYWDFLRLRLEFEDGTRFDQRIEVDQSFGQIGFPSSGTASIDVPTTGTILSYRVDIGMQIANAYSLQLYVGKRFGQTSLVYFGDAGFNPEDGIYFEGEEPSENDYYPTGDRFGLYTSQFSGTSAAAPLVSGVIALMISANPVLRREEIAEILHQTARKVDEEGGYYNAQGHSIYYGYGLIDAGAAVAEAKRRYDLYVPPQTNGWMLR